MEEVADGGEVKKPIEEMVTFLQEEHVMEYKEALVRRLVEKVGLWGGEDWTSV